MKKRIYLVSVLAFFASFSLSQAVTFGPVNQLNAPGTGPLPSGDTTCNGSLSLRMDNGAVTSDNSHATSIWSNSHTIDLRTGFETRFRIRFGDVDSAADGITFTMHRDPAGLAAIGNGGGHLGVSDYASGTSGPWGSGIEPSLNVEFDIFDNNTSVEFPPPIGLVYVNDHSDMDTSHVAISYDGDIVRPIVTPTAIGLINNTWHDVIITWNSCLNELIVRLDGTIITQLQADLVNDVFGGNPAGIYFGFTSATEAFNTTHDLCFISHKILPCNCENIDNPTMALFTPICPVGQNCMGVNFTVGQSTASSSVMIDWGDGTVTSGANNIHVYATGGRYTIRVIAQYHLLSDPMNCCIKSTTRTVNFRSTSTGGGIGFPTDSGDPESGLIQKSGSAFPNPIKKGERLTLSLSNGKTGNISIHSITGNKVMDIVNPTDSKTIKLTIPLRMKTGMYLVRFENKEIEPIKFMVD